MCLTVFSGSEGAKSSDEDPNAGARLSLLGDASLIDVNEKEAIKKRFFKLYPESNRYNDVHDFEFFKLSTQRVRFIGGFGDINWISKGAWTLPTPEWLDSEEHIVQHMNEDHEDAMQLICQHIFGISAKHVAMLTLTPDGCFLSADQSKPIFIPFANLVHSGLEVRQQLIKLTHAAREALLA